MPADLHSSLSDLKRARIRFGILALQDVFVYAPVPARPLYRYPDTRQFYSHAVRLSATASMHALLHRKVPHSCAVSSSAGRRRETKAYQSVLQIHTLYRFAQSNENCTADHSCPHFL